MGWDSDQPCMSSIGAGYPERKGPVPLETACARCDRHPKEGEVFGLSTRVDWSCWDSVRCPECWCKDIDALRGVTK